jgi:putative transposase
MAITTRKLHLENTEVVEAHRRAAGEVWTRTVRAWHWLSDRDENLSKGQAMALFAASSLAKNVRKACKDLEGVRGLAVHLSIGAWEVGWDLSTPLRPVFDRLDFDSNPFTNGVMLQAGSQQRQQPIRRFYGHVQDFFNEHLPRWKSNGKDPDSRPRLPYKPKRFARTDWTSGRVELDDGTLALKTGRGIDEITVDWPYPVPPISAQLVWDDAAREPMLCVQFDSKKQDLPDSLLREREPKGDRVAGVDLGETYFAAVFDGEGGFILNGGHLRNIRKRHNENLAELRSEIDTKQPGSNRWWKWVDVKNRRVAEMQNRTEDYLHKMSTRLVEELWNRGVETIVFGDLTGIRDDIDYGADMNRRLHQWAFRQFIEKVEYKAERYGMTVCEIGEAHTSSTCPSCGSKVHPNDRQFRCSDCGFEAHRDQMGAVAIRALFLDQEENEDLERPSRSRVFEALRARATEERSSQDSPSGRKTQPSLFESVDSRGTGSAATPTRVTPHTWSSPPRIESYRPHMDCVIEEA